VETGNICLGKRYYKPPIPIYPVGAGLAVFI